MLVMVADHSGGWVHWMAGKYGERAGRAVLGHLYSPDGYRCPTKHPWLPYALDNGAFTGFDADAYMRMLDKPGAAAIRPLWVLVPDCVGDRDETLRRWDEWAPRLADRFTLAFAAQDGMIETDVPAEARTVFLGGSMDWKLGTLRRWGAFCNRTKRTYHVGRINTWELLWLCHKAGADSVDGTGWFHHGQRADLELYLRITTGEVPDESRAQTELALAPQRAQDDVAAPAV